MIIKVENEINRFIDKCINNKIALKDIKYYKGYLIVSIDEKDLKRVKKLNYYSKITILKYLGKKELLFNIKKYYVDFIMLFLFIFILYISSNFIISIDIKNEDNNLKYKVSKILEKYDIRSLTFKKNNKELNKISDEILKNNRDFLDFISITRNGMHYEINFEERIINKGNIENEYCNVVATYDGIVTDIYYTSGISLVEVGSSFKKGDILISGEIKLNDEVKGYTCADGVVEGEVWYKITSVVPNKKIDKVYTKNVKNNLKINGRYLLNNYKNYDEEILFKIGNTRLVKQKEYKLIESTMNDDDTIEYGKSEVRKSLLNKIGNKSVILSEKVLKVIKNNSKIELETYISAKQQVSKRIIARVGDGNDSKQGV